MGAFLLNLDALLTGFLPRLELLPLIFLALFFFLKYATHSTERLARVCTTVLLGNSTQPPISNLTPCFAHTSTQQNAVPYNKGGPLWAPAKSAICFFNARRQTNTQATRARKFDLLGHSGGSAGDCKCKYRLHANKD